MFLLSKRHQKQYLSSGTSQLVDCGPFHTDLSSLNLIHLHYSSQSKTVQTTIMNILGTRYPPYPSSPRMLIEPRYTSSRALDSYGRSYFTDRPEIVSRSRSYLNCPCGLPVTAQGDHLCRSCHLITHAANQVLNIRGGDHGDCRGCSLALEDEEREIEVLDRYGYYSTG